MTQDVIQPVVLTTPGRDGRCVAAVSTAFDGVPGVRTPLVHVDTEGVGAAQATRDAIRLAAATGSHVLFLEDDLDVDVEAPQRVVATDFPAGVAVISFCDMREVAEFAPEGLYRRSPLGSDGRGWWGNQALLIHRDTAAVCAEADWFDAAVETSWGVQVHTATYRDGGRNCSDIRLAMVVHLFGGDRRDYAVSVPSVFRHVGHTSVCFPGRSMGERATRNWIADRRRFGIDQQLPAGSLNSVG